MVDFVSFCLFLLSHSPTEERISWADSHFRVQSFLHNKAVFFLANRKQRSTGHTLPWLPLPLREGQWHGPETTQLTWRLRSTARPSLLYSTSGKPWKRPLAGHCSRDVSESILIYFKQILYM